MSMSLFHVKHVAGGSLLEPKATSYLRIAAASGPRALQVATIELGNPANGEWAIREDGLIDAPAEGVVSRVLLAA